MSCPGPFSFNCIGTCTSACVGVILANNALVTLDHQKLTEFC